MKDLFGCLFAIAVMVVLVPLLLVYFAWSISYVLLYGYDTFLYESVQIQFTQLQFVAVFFIAGLLRMNVPDHKKDERKDKSAGEGLWVWLVAIVAPWITFGWLFILSLLK